MYALFPFFQIEIKEKLKTDYKSFFMFVKHDQRDRSP